ncbi:MAG: Bifunctional xylanase/deacetylase [Candidatus Dichloromethanomonas elyunquensis]|nr:MAG: Bifunctional xylanase/deacetylase [Candidatus Dichloromethanomonas elyunquensis]
MKNALTIDVEDWYMTQDFHFDYHTWGKYEDRVEYSTQLLLDTLAELNIKATFFVLGCVAEKHPGLIGKMIKQGHELASHGYAHQMVSKMSKDEFRDDIKKSKNLLEDISGIGINTFRAPTWSIAKESLWALEVLEEEGFLYDSSIQPFMTPLSGINNVPLEFFYPRVNGKTLKLLEIPPGIGQIGPFKFPFAGGLYFRVIPYFIVKSLVKMTNIKRPLVSYFHPWEVDPKQPRLDVSPLIKIAHYYHLENNLKKIKQFLKDFDCMPIREVIQADGDYPVFEICN